jgi:hypothetical protein
MRNLQFEALFPDLKTNGYTLTSPATPDYNCIAWAAGKNDRWWWPDPSPMAYWPEEPRECTLNSFIRVFRSMGYETCNNPALEEGFEKVAIYVKDSRPTHMARQLHTGDWTSKCGRSEDMSHTLDGLEHSGYGEVAVIMKRQRIESASC